MKTLKKLTIVASALVLTALATGCTKDNGNATGPEIIEPAPETNYYDVTVRLHRFYVNGDCDAGLIGGKGEFSYGIEIKRELTPGSGTYVHVAYVDSKDYPKSSGTQYKRSDDDNININQEVYVGRLEEGCDYKVIASAIEWDGIGNTKKDDDMGGSPKEEVDRAGGKAHYEHKLTLGSSGSCQLYLYFDCDETLVK